MTTLAIPTAPSPAPGPDTRRPAEQICYATIRVCGTLALLHTPADQTGVFPLARRTLTGVAHRYPLRDGVHAWLSGDDARRCGPANLTGGYLLRVLANEVAYLDRTDFRDEDPTDQPLVYGQVVFTGFNAGRVVGLTATQQALLTQAHAYAQARVEWAENALAAYSA